MKVGSVIGFTTMFMVVSGSFVIINYVAGLVK